MALPFGDWEGIAEGHPQMEEKAETGFGMTKRTGRTRPIEHVYRGMSHEEWAGAQKNGFIQSDGRQAIMPEWEGTNASHDPAVAEYYLRTTKHTETAGGVVAKIAVHPDEHWFTSSVDNYLRTRHRIPLSRVLSTQFVQPD